jgi:hypothetical protein
VKGRETQEYKDTCCKKQESHHLIEASRLRWCKEPHPLADGRSQSVPSISYITVGATFRILPCARAERQLVAIRVIQVPMSEIPWPAKESLIHQRRTAGRMLGRITTIPPSTPSTG